MSNVSSIVHFIVNTVADVGNAAHELRVTHIGAVVLHSNFVFLVQLLVSIAVEEYECARQRHDVDGQHISADEHRTNVKQIYEARELTHVHQYFSR